MEELSNNLQATMMMFIDGLSFIDLDPYWNYYLLYKKVLVSKGKVW